MKEPVSKMDYYAASCALSQSEYYRMTNMFFYGEYFIIQKYLVFSVQSPIHTKIIYLVFNAFSDNCFLSNHNITHTNRN